MSDTQELSADNQAYRRAAEAYFADKCETATAQFDDRLLGVFKAFEEHWRTYFAPTSPPRLREYLAVPPALRRAQFERFRRECRSWELNFQISDSNGRGRRPVTGSERERTAFRRRVEKQNDREAEVRRFYEDLDSLLEQQRQRPLPPPDVLVHLRVLGVQPHAPLQEVKSQYRKLALEHHPDRAGDQAKMQRLNQAFREVVSYYKTVSV